MSWYFEFAADSKASAKNYVDELADGNRGNVPAGVVALIGIAIDAQADEAAIRVKSNGHIGGSGSQTVTIEVSCMELVHRASPASESSGESQTAG